ncbi:glucans biosynthesis glucosyltransferase MdoH [Saccharibacter sp. EH60]|nr:glucans biosynthesis glucosyltransferase MdoH [Saccharibacter sp. EH60]
MNWEKASEKRLLIVRFLAFCLSSFLFSVSIIAMVLYHVSLWIAMPFILASTALGLLGTTTFLSMFVGLWSALRPLEKDIYHPFHTAKPLKEDTRIAILMPIYHEDARRVAGALSAMIEDLKRYDDYKKFHFFILSDSRKEDLIAQEIAVTQIMRDRYKDISIFYRQRIMNSYAKMGNTSDFFKRWGKNYNFVVMLDADSIVPANTIMKMAQSMEGNSRIGLIQAVCYGINGETLFSRWRSFLSNISASVFLHGQYFFKLGRGNYFGHNAIIRVDAFMKYCNLPDFRRKGPFSAGKPLSHDFVEVMFLEGAGYDSWLLPQLDSYEDQVPTLIDALKREARWMNGALAWLRLFMMKRFSKFGRMQLFVSAMSYFNVVTGLIFFLIGLYGTSYILSHPLKSMIILKKFHTIFVISFVYIVIGMLAPFCLYALYFYKMKKMKHFGGFMKFAWSYALAICLQLIIAPLEMMQLVKILFFWAKGKKLVWSEQNRSARVVPWKEAIDYFLWVSVFGALVLYYFLFFILSKDTPKVDKMLHFKGFVVYFWFLLPLLGLCLAPFWVRVTSREYKWMKQLYWFAEPSETALPTVVGRTHELTSEYERKVPENFSFEDILVKPWFSLRYMATIPSRPHKTKFWSEHFEGKKIKDLNRLEKLLISRNRDLWEIFFRKHHGI